MSAKVPAHIYVIEYSDATIKVGYSQNSNSRMGDHARQARIRGVSISRNWVSEPHTNAPENEVALIAFCRSQGVDPLGRSKEYFARIAYEDALTYAQSLPKTPHVGHPVVGLTRAREELLELAEASHRNGQITIITRGNKSRPYAAIVPLNRIAKEPAMTITVTALAAELSTTRDDVLVLVDQLTTLDGSENVVASETRDEVTLTSEAADAIREQIGSDQPADAYIATVGEDNAEWLSGQHGPTAQYDKSVRITDLGDGQIRIPADAIEILLGLNDSWDGVVDKENSVLRIHIEGTAYRLTPAEDK